MVLNHSSTPTDVEQVGQTELKFYKQATKAEVEFRNKTGSNLKKIYMLAYKTFFYAFPNTDVNIWN